MLAPGTYTGKFKVTAVIRDDDTWVTIEGTKRGEEINRPFALVANETTQKIQEGDSVVLKMQVHDEQSLTILPDIEVHRDGTLLGTTVVAFPTYFRSKPQP